MRAEGDLLAPTVAGPEGGGWNAASRARTACVLVVSESPVWRSELSALLEADGYVVHHDERGEAILDAGGPFDIAIVDLAVTGRTAAGVLADLRARSSLPILAIASERHREPDVLEAYAAGVDQLLTRSMRPHELMARIRALLRRSPPVRRDAVIVDAEDVGISLDLATGLATVAGREVSFTRRESEILCALLQRPGRLVTRDQLGKRGAADRALDSIVRSVRSKLESAEGRRRVVTVRGVGFRLALDAELDAR